MGKQMTEEDWVEFKKKFDSPSKLESMHTTPETIAAWDKIVKEIEEEKMNPRKPREVILGQESKKS